MGFWDDIIRESSFSSASRDDLPYVVLQVVLKEKLIGTGSRNLDSLQEVINRQVKKGYRLHTISTANGGSKGLAGGDRIQATMVFEKLNIETNHQPRVEFPKNLSSSSPALQTTPGSNANDEIEDPRWERVSYDKVRCPQCSKEITLNYIRVRRKCHNCGCEYGKPDEQALSSGIQTDMDPTGKALEDSRWQRVDDTRMICPECGTIATHDYLRARKACPKCGCPYDVG